MKVYCEKPGRRAVSADEQREAINFHFIKERFQEVIMEKSKVYLYDYDEYEGSDKGPSTMVADILADPEFPELAELRIGNWGDSWEDGCQPILDDIVANGDRFSHIRKLFIGDMDYEECEVSWIVQGNYDALWAALPHLKELTIKGSTDLELGNVRHDGLESLTVICGGLPVSVIEAIQNAQLPNLKKLLLYIGSDYYGFDGDEKTIQTLLEKADFPKLEYLGITDSEIQDDLTKVVLESKFMTQIHTLDLSAGTLTDKGGALILEKIPACPNIKTVDLHYHYLSDNMMRELEDLPVEIDLSEQNEPENYHGDIWMNAMLTE